MVKNDGSAAPIILNPPRHLFEGWGAPPHPDKQMEGAAKKGRAVEIAKAEAKSIDYVGTREAARKLLPEMTEVVTVIDESPEMTAFKGHMSPIMDRIEELKADLVDERGNEMKVHYDEQDRKCILSVYFGNYAKPHDGKAGYGGPSVRVTWMHDAHPTVDPFHLTTADFCTPEDDALPNAVYRDENYSYPKFNFGKEALRKALPDLVEHVLDSIGERVPRPGM